MIFTMIQEVLLDVEAARVRLVLRIYFTAVLLIISFLGDICCSLRVKLRLYQHQLIPLRQMTGWLSGSRLVTATVSLGGTPAGWLGLVMLLGTLLSFACDLAVSVLVGTTHVPGRCHFNTTGSYSVLTNADFDQLLGPITRGPLYDFVTNAQATGLRNGGIGGIYVKINNDQNFRPEEQDIVGTWTCEFTDSHTFPATMSHNAVYDALIAEGLLFNVSSWYSYRGSNNTFYEMFAWSASQGDRPAAPWTVLAAVQSGMSTTLPKKMNIYSCYLGAASLDWLLQRIEVQKNLVAWTDIVQEAVFPSMASPTNYVNLFPNDIGLVIATKLNTMMMILGAARSTTAVPAAISDPSVGCIVAWTLVPWSVCVLFVLTALLAIGMAIYLLTLAWATRLFRKSKLNTPAYIKAVEKATPNGLIGWMRRAAEETAVSVQTSPLKTRSGPARLKRWLVSQLNLQWANSWRFGPSNAATTLGGGDGSRQKLVGLVCLTPTAVAEAGSGESRELLKVPPPYQSPSMQKQPAIEEENDDGDDDVGSVEQQQHGRDSQHTVHGAFLADWNLSPSTRLHG